MPDIKRLRDEIQPSDTDSGDGKGKKWHFALGQAFG